LAHPGRNLLFFIHGFDNNFSDALTRAAFNAAWLAASAVAAADTTVIAFSWPSAGEIVDFPVLTGAYSGDQQMAKLSGPHLMSVLANLNPIITAARVSRPDIRVILLAHSMGNLALSSAVEHWFLAGNGDGLIFDDAILAAADCPYEAFAQPKLAQLSGLSRLAERISIYYSGADQVLQLSMAVNLGAQRLGQDGPLHRTDPAAFPPATFSMVDCSAIRDYQYGFLSSHQYYRLSPAVRSIIAASIGGAAT
jgi:esterase/lipase superfamily enzyme